MEDGRIRSHRDLIAWQKAMGLVEMAYAVSKTFPKDEVYGLTEQLRRAAVSIPANIAEGQGRRSKKDFTHFLGNARGHCLSWIRIWNWRCVSGILIQKRT